MSKPRKLHQLIITIEHAWLGQSKSQQWKNQPFYCLDVIHENLLTKIKTQVYVFLNLVSKNIWNTLEQETFKNKKYLAYCEKRTRGWRLREWQEIN